MKSIKDLEYLLEDPYNRAAEEKKRGRKIIAITPMHFPEELVHASGALPVILQTSNEPITLGWEHIFPHFCAFVRTNVDLSVKGKLDFLDGLVISDLCLQTRGMSWVIQRHLHAPIMYMNWPLERNMERWTSVLLRDLGRVRKKLGEITGRFPADDDIKSSIRLYNLNRQLLRRIDEFRRKKPGVLRARDMLLLVISSMVMPKEEHNGILKRVIAELEVTEAPGDGRVRVWLSGHMCLRVLPEILDILEEAGAVIVGDDLYVGYRYYAANIPVHLPPMEGLLWRHFNVGVPCPTRYEKDLDWADFLSESVRKTHAQGVVSLQVKQCECQTYYYPHVARKLTAMGYPFIRVETDHEIVSLSRTKTQFQGLVESVRNRLASTS